MKKEYRNSLRTKKMIRSAFAELIGEKKMIANISVAELADRADIAKSTFYNHYEDIYSVADEVMQEAINRLDAIIDAMEADKNSDYRIYIKSIFKFIEENADIYGKLCSSPDAVFFIDRVKHVISKRAFTNISSPFLSKNREERYVQISFIANACVDTIVEYLRGDIDLTFDELEGVVMSLLNKFM